MALKFLFGLCLFNLTFSATLHLATYVDIRPMEHLLAVMGLQLGFLALFVIFGMHRISGIGKTTQPGSPGLSGPDRLFPGVAIWVEALCWILLGYVFVFWLWYVIQADGAAPSFIGGQAVMEYRGHVFRSLTAEEYNQQWTWIMRGISGIWLWLSWLGMGVLISQAHKQAGGRLDAPSMEARPPSPTPPMQDPQHDK